MKTLIANNVHVEYDLAGTGRVVVLLHAFPLCRTMWQSQKAALQTEYRLLLPDYRGFGGSSPFDQTPSVDQLALDIKEPVVLGGMSMGGYVALAVARQNPTRLRGLVLADTRAEADDAQMKASRDEMFAFIQTNTVLEVIDRMLPKLLSPATRSNRPGVVDDVRRCATALTTAGIVAAWEALRDRPDARPGLANICVPTLVMVGSDDELTTPAVAERLAAGIAGAQLVTIPGAGHLSNMEQPSLFNAALLTFLKSFETS
jgi:3-oxoadipate enol-lactonase